jgi:acetylornithine deacetylase/succinyl-diaminopimelate desuccinylase-like protein
MDTTALRQLFAHIDEQLPHYYDSWARIPEGIATAEAALVELRRHNVETLALNQRHDMLTGTWPGTEPALLFVVPLAARGPRRLLPLLITLAALDACRRHASARLPSLKWLITTSEAANMNALPDIMSAHQERLKAAGGIWHINEHIEESTNVLFLGSKGYLLVELQAHSAAQPLPAMYGTFAPNAAWRLVWALGSLKSEREEVLLKGFYDNLEPPEDDALTPLYTLPEQEAQQWGLDQFLLNLRGFQLHYARLLTPSCTITTIDSGSETAEPMLPHSARAELEFHLVPGQDPADVFSRLQQHLVEHGFPDVRARLLAQSAATYTRSDMPFVQMVRRAFAPAPLVLPMTTGGYPAASLCHERSLPMVFTNLGRSENVAQRIKQIATLILEFLPQNRASVRFIL